MAAVFEFPKVRPKGQEALAVITAYGGLMASELEQFSRVWAGVAERGYASGLAGAMALMRCRTPQDLIAAHADLLCDELELLRGAWGEVSEIVAASAGEAVRTIDQPKPTPALGLIAPAA
ncbi:MAG: phasin family protein [Caulobacteraceae bacterium]